MKEYKDEVDFVLDGRKYKFKTERNPLNGQQMWWFEPLVTMYAGTAREARKIAYNIRRKR